MSNSVTQYLLGVVADTQKALGFTDDQVQCANGSIEIVAEIIRLRQDNERLGLRISELEASEERNCESLLAHEQREDRDARRIEQLEKAAPAPRQSLGAAESECTAPPGPCVSHVAYTELQSKVDQALLFVDRLAADRDYCEGEFINDVRRLLGNEADTVGT